ncbi:hypothetical protein HKD37_05G014206 [Glycine soja]
MFTASSFCLQMAHCLLVWHSLNMDGEPSFYAATCVDWLVNNINSPPRVEMLLFFKTSSDVINVIQQSMPLKAMKSVRWEASNFPFIKLNTDGSSSMDAFLQAHVLWEGNSSAIWLNTLVIADRLMFYKHSLKNTPIQHPF